MLDAEPMPRVQRAMIIFEGDGVRLTHVSAQLHQFATAVGVQQLHTSADAKHGDSAIAAPSDRVALTAIANWRLAYVIAATQDQQLRP